MTDPVAEAAAQIAAQQSVATNNPQVEEAGTAMAGESQASSQMQSSLPASSSAPQSSASESESPAPSSGSPATMPDSGELPNAADTQAAGAAMPVGTEGDLPRESHLLLLEAKIAAFRAKLANAERVALDEFESIVGHLKAVL